MPKIINIALDPIKTGDKINTVSNIQEPLPYDRKYTLTKNTRELIFDALRRNYETRNYQNDFNVSKCKCKLI